MKTTKRISYSALAIISFAVTMTTVSCQSKQDKNASSEQSNDSAFVFSTPKVIDMKGYFEKKEQLKKLDTTMILRLSDIADDVEYVLLKASNGKQEVFIGQGFKNLFICKDYIFVHMTDNIIQYDRQGNLIRTIGRKGRGPGEYVWVYNMVVDDKEKRILITDTSGKINEYDFEGKFVRDIKTPYSGKLIPLDAGRIALDVENVWYDVKERLVILNEKGEVEKSFPRYQLFEHADYGRTDGKMGLIPRITKFHDVVCFNEAYNDTIFELKNNELHMRYFIDWGKWAPKAKYFIEPEKYEDMQWKCMVIKGFYETDRYIIMPELRYPYTFVYDKKEDKIKERASCVTKNSKLFTEIFKEAEGGFFNDVDGGLVQNIDGISLDCKYIYCSYYASDVKDYYEEAEYGEYALHPDKQAKLKALVDTVDEDKHNLFIMMSKLKE